MKGLINVSQNDTQTSVQTDVEEGVSLENVSAAQSAFSNRKNVRPNDVQLDVQLKETRSKEAFRSSESLVGKPQNKPQITSLTGIRAALIFWVVLFHMQPELAALLPYDPLLHFASAGFLGVDFFFILSGFVIAYNYAERLNPFSLGTYRRFLSLRLARIYPVHLFSLLLVLLLYLVAMGTGSTTTNPAYYSAHSFIQNLLLIQAWSLPTALSWNAIAWAVSCEWLAYLLFPLVLMLTLRVRSATSALGIVVISLLGMSLGCVVLGHQWPAVQGAGSFGLARVAVEFPVGCLLYSLYASRWGKGWRWSAITPVLWAAVIVSSVSLNAYLSRFATLQENNLLQVYLLSLTPLFAIAIYALAQQRGGFSRFFCAKWIEKVAHTSYSLYLTHFICLIVLRRAFSVEGFATSSLIVRLLVIGGYLLLMAIAAGGTYYFVEEPSRLWVKNKLLKKTARI